MFISASVASLHASMNCQSSMVEYGAVPVVPAVPLIPLVPAVRGSKGCVFQSLYFVTFISKRSRNSSDPLHHKNVFVTYKVGT